MTVQSFLAEIESRLNAATPGQWLAHERNESSVFREFEIRVHAGTLFRSTSYGRMAEDAQLIAHAPTDLARLLAIVREYEAALKKAAGNVTWVAPAADGENQIILTYGYHVEACRRALATAEKIAGGVE